MKTTIVVSPRERLSSVVPSLKSLFASIDASVPVIVVEGRTPEPIRAQIAQLQNGRAFEHVALDHMVTSNEARNIGVAMAETPYVVLADNDLDYEPNWLEALERNAIENEADAVAPLILIGPLPDKTIHHAGGHLAFSETDGHLSVKENHRLMNARYDEVEAQLSELAPVKNEICEFHCMMLKKAVWDAMGGLDERLITREQMDFALRMRARGATVTFEKESHVTHRMYDPFNAHDLEYHLFRWSDHRAVQSLDAFEGTWDMKLDRKRIRKNWIANHRWLGIRATYPVLKNRLIAKLARGPMMWWSTASAKRNERALRGDVSRKPVVPVKPAITGLAVAEAQ